MPTQPNHFALVIGINDYPNFKSLKGPKDDALNFYKWLIDSETGGGLKKENVLLFQSDNTKPFKDEIDIELDKLLDQVDKSDTSVIPRRFYFYFSGHGLGLTSTDVGLCLPIWGTIKFQMKALKMMNYVDNIKSKGQFHEVFVFLDCCRTSLLVAGGEEFSSAILKPFPDAKHVILYATSNTNPSFEAPISEAGAEKTDKINGFFTTALIEALTGGAAVKEGGVPLINLVTYLKQEVPKLAAKNKKSQSIDENYTISITEIDNISFGNARPSSKATNAIITRGGGSVFPFKIVKNQHDIVMVDVEILVYDYMSDLVKPSPSFTDFIQDLEPGEYRIEWKYPGMAEPTTQFVQHTAHGTNIVVDSPQVFSSIPMQYAANSHEYYSENAANISLKLTAPQPINNGQNAGLMIFARFTDQKRSKPIPFFEEWTLLNDKGDKILDFEPDFVQNDAQMGWYAFSAQLAAGQYYLHFSGKKDRTFPVFCFEGWQSQVFIGLFEEQPRLETLRIFTAPLGKGFEPQNPIYWRMNTAYECLLNPHMSIPPSLTAIATSSPAQPIDTPMEGILLATLYYQRKQVEAAKRILGQLLKLMPANQNCADIALLKLLLDDTTKNATFEHIPMLGHGFECLIELNIEGKVQLEAQSLANRMSVSRGCDLVIANVRFDESQEASIYNNTWLQEEVVKTVRKLVQLNIPTDINGLARQYAVTVPNIRTAIDNGVLDLKNRNLPDDMPLINALLSILNNDKYMPAKKALKIVAISPSGKMETALLEEFEKNCIQKLVDKALIEYWDTRKMFGGEIRLEVIEKKLQAADLVIGLVSSGYLNNGEAFNMHTRTLDLQKKLIPIIVMPCLFEIEDEIKNRNPIPIYYDGKVKPVSMWKEEERDAAWQAVGTHLLQLILEQ
jgi:Caspase domain